MVIEFCEYGSIDDVLDGMYINTQQACKVSSLDVSVEKQFLLSI
jgi:hypothetical protein